MITDSFEKIFGNKSRIMAIFAHPDDAQIYCGGTLARLTHAGKHVMIIKMTSGNRGSRQENITKKKLAETRTKEDEESLRVLGISKEDNICLEKNDGDVENSLETIGLLAKQIRLFKPELIITHNPQDMVIRFDKNVNWINHRDHRNTGTISIDASYPYSRDLLFFPEHFKDISISSHAVTEFLLVDYYDHPDLVYIDVVDFLEIRTKSIACHASQYSLEHAKESTEFFTRTPQGMRAERFRYVKAD